MQDDAVRRQTLYGLNDASLMDDLKDFLTKEPRKSGAPTTLSPTEASGTLTTQKARQQEEQKHLEETLNEMNQMQQAQRDSIQNQQKDALDVQKEEATQDIQEALDEREEREAIIQNDTVHQELKELRQNQSNRNTITDEKDPDLQADLKELRESLKKDDSKDS